MTSVIRVRAAVASVALAVASVAGCDNGPERFPTAPASGVVRCGGRPLAAGRVVFSPIAKSGSANSGKQARAYVDENGAFTLSTYADGDGAVVGDHKVFVETAGGGDLSDCRGFVSGTLTVTEEGPNEFTIDLEPLTAADLAARAGGDEDEEDEDD